VTLPEKKKKKKKKSYDLFNDLTLKSGDTEALSCSDFEPGETGGFTGEDNVIDDLLNAFTFLEGTGEVEEPESPLLS
jgi:hypothetical protein